MWNFAICFYSSNTRAYSPRSCCERERGRENFIAPHKGKLNWIETPKRYLSAAFELMSETSIRKLAKSDREKKVFRRILSAIKKKKNSRLFKNLEHTIITDENNYIRCVRFGGASERKSISRKARWKMHRVWPSSARVRLSVWPCVYIRYHTHALTPTCLHVCVWNNLSGWRHYRRPTYGRGPYWVTGRSSQRNVPIRAWYWSELFRPRYKSVPAATWLPTYTPPAAGTDRDRGKLPMGETASRRKCSPRRKQQSSAR